jgi:hypothetical protein
MAQWTANVTSDIILLNNTGTNYSGVLSSGSTDPFDTQGFSNISGTFTGFMLENPNLMAIVIMSGNPSPIFLISQPSGCPILDGNPTNIDLIGLNAANPLTIASFGNTGCDSSTDRMALLNGMLHQANLTNPGPALYILYQGTSASIGGEAVDATAFNTFIGAKPSPMLVGTLYTSNGTTQRVGFTIGGAQSTSNNQTAVLNGGRYNGTIQTYGTEITLGFSFSGTQGVLVDTAPNGAQTFQKQPNTQVVVTSYGGTNFIFALGYADDGTMYNLLLTQQ